jgi:purine-binding chemotaxis protein CheW
MIRKGENIMEKLAEKELQEQEEDTRKGKFLTFSLGSEFYGIEIEYVTEIIAIQPITEIPQLPEYVKGIINLRGKIIPVMDVRLRFKKEPKEYNDRTCVVVVEIKDIYIGLIVDSVSEVLSIQEQNIVPPPAVNKGQQNRYIKGIGKVENDVKLILDCKKLLTEDEIENLSETL